MAKITIQTTIDSEKIHSHIDQIYATCQTEPNLSPRPKKELIDAYHKGFLLVATSGVNIAGWILRIPFNKNVQELAAGYVVDPYRSQGVFHDLLNSALTDVPTSLLVTFNYPLAEYLFDKAGFRKSSLWEVTRLSRGKFFLNRLHINRLQSIRKHYQSHKPIYAIFVKK